MRKSLLLSDMNVENMVLVTLFRIKHYYFNEKEMKMLKFGISFDETNPIGLLFFQLTREKNVLFWFDRRNLLAIFVGQ